MSREAYSPPDPAGWQVLGLKLILFPVASQIREQREWWRGLTGNEPDETSRKKDTVEEAGVIGGEQRLTVTITPIKLQIAVEKAVTPEQAVERLPVLGQFIEQKEQFLNLLGPWLQNAPPIKRVGFAANLIYPVASQVEGYRMLDRFLETVDVDSECSDFSYRVNRKTQTTAGVTAMSVNQLMTWAAQRLILKTIAISAERLEMQSDGDDEFFAALDLDVNTHQNQVDPFPEAEVEGLCRELARLAVERATHGDRRS